MAFTNDTIYGYLPRFYQVEANNLKALQPGFVVAQIDDVDDALTTGAVNIPGSSDSTPGKLVANGHIVIVTVDGNGKATIKSADDAGATGSEVLYIVYNDPIITIGASNDYARYATNIDGECLRLVQLIPGDEWMTDMAYDLSGNLSGRIVEMKGGANGNSADWYNVDTLADGTTAKHYIFLG